MSELEKQLLRELDRGERLFQCKMPYPNESGWSYTIIGANDSSDAKIMAGKIGFEFVRELYRPD